MSARYLFHGSNQTVEKPEIGFSAHKTDFGNGFYATESQRQAEEWAQKVCDRRSSGAPTVSIYQFEPSEDLKVLSFKRPDSAWLEFVLSNRIYNKEHDYDIVSGPVADDGVFATLYAYVHGRITMATAIKLLKTRKMDGQISFHTAEAIKSLSFIKSYVVK